MAEFLSSVTGAVFIAILSWWLGTGAILWLVRLPARLFCRSMATLTFLVLLSTISTAWSMRQATMAASYVGFVSVIVMWGWHEMAFLSGWITGPRRIPQESGARGWRRFHLAVQALLHHEIGLLLNMGMLLLLQWGNPNHVALCTFTLLWCMRVSAKLNLFCGVPHVGDQYLPEHLAYMGSYFRRSPVTACFYLTISLSGGTWLWLVLEAQRDTVTISTGWVLLASLLGLAIVEHVLMVFALPLQRLWGWAMGQRKVLPEALHTAMPTPMTTTVPTPSERQ
jgi:putative photosynthetic complex assembly protein 2